MASEDDGNEYGEEVVEKLPIAKARVDSLDEAEFGESEMYASEEGEAELMSD